MDIGDDVSGEDADDDDGDDADDDNDDDEAEPLDEGDDPTALAALSLAAAESAAVSLPIAITDSCFSVMREMVQLGIVVCVHSPAP